MLRFVNRASWVAVAWMGSLWLSGCLGGGSSPGGEVGPAVEVDGGSTAAPSAFHLRPKNGTTVPADWTTIEFRGRVVPSAAGQDLRVYRATWVDLTTGTDLCRTYAEQGPWCTVAEDGEVRMVFPRTALDFDPGEHPMEFRVSWQQGADIQTVSDAFVLVFLGGIEPPRNVRLSWSPSTGDKCALSSDRLTLAVDLAELPGVAGQDVTFDLQWYREPALELPRVHRGLTSCASPDGQGTALACTVEPSATRVGETWWATVTVTDNFGAELAPQESNRVDICNSEPECEDPLPQSADDCAVNLRSGEGVNGRYRCAIVCQDPDNLLGTGEEQPIYYHFQWSQQDGRVVLSGDVEGAGIHDLVGRSAFGDGTGTPLDKGLLTCTVWATNSPWQPDMATSVTAQRCQVYVGNVPPTIGGARVVGENSDFPGRTDQRTVYTCEPDLASLVDPDDDPTDETHFLYHFEWNAESPSGDNTAFRPTNPENEQFPGRCDPTCAEGGIRRGDTLCCRSVPGNPGPEGTEPDMGTAPFGNADLCVTIQNTPPYFEGVPRLEIVTEGGLVQPFATETSTIRCSLAEATFRDCDCDAAGDHTYRWFVQAPDANPVQVQPIGDPARLNGAYFNKGDCVSCAVIPSDRSDTGLPVPSPEPCATVLNSPPEIADVQVNPLIGDKNMLFDCLASWSDADPADRDAGTVDVTVEFEIDYPPDDGTPPAPQFVADRTVADANGNGLLDLAERPSYPEFGNGTRIHCCAVANDGSPENGVSARVCSMDRGHPAAQVTDGSARIQRVDLEVVQGPDPATADSRLRCVPVGWMDAEGDQPGYEFRWFIGAATQPERVEGPGSCGSSPQWSELSNPPGTTPRFSRGDQVRCEVRTWDCAQYSPETWSAAVTIQNTCWTATSMRLEPQNGHNGAADRFTCIATFRDPDILDIGFEANLQYRWFQLADPVNGPFENPVGDNGLPFAGSEIPGDLLVANRADRLVCCGVRECAAAGEPPLACSTNSASVTNDCPTIQTVTVTPNEPRVGTTARCEATGWDDTEDEAPRYEYQWRLGGVPIDEATAATLPLTSAMAHRTLSCGMRPVDSSSHEPQCVQLMSSGRVIANSLPTISGVSIEPAEVFTDSDAVCVPEGFSDADGDPEGYAFWWLVNGQPVDPGLLASARFEGDTLLGGAFTRGDTLVCQATPSDGYGLGDMRPADKTVVNRPPTVEVVVENPEVNPDRDQRFTCSFTADDPDGDAVTGTFVFYLGEEEWALPPEADLDPAPDRYVLDPDPDNLCAPDDPWCPLSPCQEVTCEVRPNDGVDDGPAASDSGMLWGGAAVRFAAATARLDTAVTALPPAEGTIDFWFRLEQAPSGGPRTVFEHSPGAGTVDRVRLVIGTDRQPLFSVGASVLTPTQTAAQVPLNRWVYYAIQWSAALGTWDVLVYIPEADYGSGRYELITLGLPPVSAWTPSALRFGSGTTGAALGSLDEIRFSSVRRLTAGIQSPAPAAFHMPAGGDDYTLALYHITANHWGGTEIPEWSYTSAAAVMVGAEWSGDSLRNECQYLQNYPPPAPGVELVVEGTATTPASPQVPGYIVHYDLVCQVAEPSIDFNADPVGYEFHWLEETADGTVVDRGTDVLDPDDVAQGLDYTTRRVSVQSSSRQCVTVRCIVRAFDAQSYGDEAEATGVAGYVGFSDLTQLAAMSLGCTPGSECLLGTCVVAQGGCRLLPRAGTCNDLNPCTTDDRCLAGACTGTNPCDDSLVDPFQCTANTCLPVAGGDPPYTCNNAPLTGTTCNDQNACTSQERCDAQGACVGTAVNCEDGNVCTVNTCNPQSGCQVDNTSQNTEPCPSANQCVRNTTCWMGSCQGGEPVSVDDQNQCTHDYCTPTDGILHDFRTGESCDDGNFCTVTDVCRVSGISISCQGAGSPNCEDGNVCTFGTCNPTVPNPVPGQVGNCEQFPLPDQPCNDADACTVNDRCDAEGECTVGDPRNCGDGDVCTNDLCDSDTGCYHTFNTAPCNDGSACTQLDACSEGLCVGTAVNCDDGNACTRDGCNEGSGCYHNFQAVACNDQNACTGDDFCVETGPQGQPNYCMPRRELCCANTRDDDADGRIDCADSDCFGTVSCRTEVGLCGDNADNDQDGCTDAVDSDCAGEEANCANDSDDDCDGRADCLDDDCFGVTGCNAETACDDQADNDSDGCTDGDDDDCGGTEDGLCANGLDDDCDGLSNCADSDCAGETGAGGVCQYGTESTCNDGFDNDADGLVDCRDPQCNNRACDDGNDTCTTGDVCAGTTCRGRESCCNDGLDNDGDGNGDCRDPDCNGQQGEGWLCQYPSETACGDGFDNDGDGNADCRDLDCFGVGGCDAETVCNDGQDNDSDGETDCADADCCGATGCALEAPCCWDGRDNDSDSAIDCADSACCGNTLCHTEGPLCCSDTVDNDGDGCTDAIDASCGGRENGPAPGQPSLCFDGLDRDCDNVRDCADSDCNNVQYLGRTCQFGRETSCADGFDNDADSRTDCADSDCFGSTCPELCTGGLDEDADGCTDGVDASCGGVEPGSPAVPARCFDNLDSDCDGLRDCRDDNCNGVTFGANTCQFGTELSCRDGFDNDGDGLTDCQDANCFGTTCAEVCTGGLDEDGDGCTDAIDSNCNGTERGTPAENLRCFDGLDRDCDGLTDCQDDNCHNITVSGNTCRFGNESGFCTDNFDNDGDGLADCLDPDCYGPLCNEVCPPADVGHDEDGDGCTDTWDSECTGTERGVPPQNSRCFDVTDTDCDGSADCRDSDCNNVTYNNQTCQFGTERTCNDAFDNDGDGQTDCQDPNCFGSTCPEVCTGGLDEDADGCIDAVDSACGGKERSGAAQNPNCFDSLDQDCDTFADCRDNDCDGATGSGSRLCQYGVERACTGGFDNDGDGLTDCADPNCFGPACAEVCTGGQDEDGDGCTDGRDADCSGTERGSPAVNSRCFDGTDYDCDGLIDCLDGNCNNVTYDGHTCQFGTETLCSDAFDNDGDAATDCVDQNCNNLQGAGGICQYGTEVTCNDAFDNDGDTLVDCADTQCNLRPCNDGNACTGDDTCISGVCDGGTEICCSDGQDNDGDGTTDLGDPDCCNLQSCSLSSDGCCPSGCNATNDVDCCNATSCVLTPGNGCCPASCTPANDRDCCDATTCSNSGSNNCCPTTCTPANDRDCCNLTACSTSSSNNCCPANCTPASDRDCCNVDPAGCSSTANGCCKPGCTILNDQDCCNATACNNTTSDGCCPASCTPANDRDCCAADTCRATANSCCPAGCTVATDQDCCNTALCSNVASDGCCPSHCDPDEDLDCCNDDSCRTTANSCCPESCTVANDRDCCNADTVGCSPTTNSCCPATCTIASDQDCCNADSCRTNANSCCPNSCLPGNDRDCCNADTCRTTANSCCPSTCTPGNDRDCCEATTCSNSLVNSCCPGDCTVANDRDCCNADSCRTAANSCCPSECTVGNDRDCCNADPAGCSATRNGCCKQGCTIANDQDCCDTLNPTCNPTTTNNCCPLSCTVATDKDCCNAAACNLSQTDGCCPATCTPATDADCT